METATYQSSYAASSPSLSSSSSSSIGYGDSMQIVRIPAFLFSILIDDTVSSWIPINVEDNEY